MRGIAPEVLLSQVRSTAAWALEDRPGEARGWVDALVHADEVASARSFDDAAPAYLRMLLAAHFTTVATFVPTDVDARIRHHHWQSIETPEALRAAIAIVDEAAAWDPRLVSRRVVSVEGEARGVSGHDGEWFSVRAGALGRALVLEDRESVDRLASQIDEELAREARTMQRAKRADATTALSVATILAHNVGDLSRVVEEWPSVHRHGEIARRFARLGHERPERYDGAFVFAGEVNKAVMAIENHRFLAMRRVRALRASFDLLLPIAPFWDRWGETIGKHPGLDDEARAETLGALVDMHAQNEEQQGALRAIAGLHRTAPGGVDRLARDLPARARKLSAKVREALKVEERHFLARIEKRWKTASERLG